eukprot:PLAT7064.2.p1 GENE.PLAT7064.2~~PLAT7064.2.p1  ORF type:complete len:568 (-),score=135.24 PLAT7064.2:286-1989(-)
MRVAPEVSPGREDHEAGPAEPESTFAERGKVAASEESDDEIDFFDVPALSSESFYGPPQMPRAVAAVARLFPAYDAKALLPYALVLLSVGLCFVLVPIARMSLVPLSVNRGMAIFGRSTLRVLNDAFLALFFTPYMWDEVYPCVLSKRQWRKYALSGVGLFAVSAVLLTAYGEEDFTRALQDIPLGVQIGTAVEDTLQTLYHSCVPVLFMMPTVRKALKMMPYPGYRATSCAMNYGAALVIFYGITALVLYAFGNSFVLALGPGSLLVWAGCLWLDRDFKAVRHAGYGVAANFISRGAGLGAASVLAFLLPRLRGTSGGTLIMLATFSFAFGLLRACWSGVARKLWKDPDAQAHLFSLQVVEDTLGELCFLGARLDSPLFWLAAVLNSVKQVVRDTAVLSNAVHGGVRLFRGLPELTLKEEASRFELQWRMLKQNLMSELIANVCLPVLFLSDMLWAAIGVGADTFTAGLSGEDIAHQLGAFAVLLVMEVVSHRIVTMLLKKRMHQLALRGIYTDASTKAPVTGSYVQRRTQSGLNSYFLKKWPVFVSLLYFALQDSVLRAVPLSQL